MLRRGIRRVLRLRPTDNEDVRGAVREELQHHLALSIEHLRQQGYTPEGARAEAMRRLGEWDSVQERLYHAARYREQRMRFRDWLDAIVRDLRHAVRGLQRQPVLTTVVVLTLALGMGVNAAIFPMVDRLLFRNPAGVREVNEVRRVYVADRSAQGAGEVRYIFNYPEFEDIRRGLQGVADVGTYMTSTMSVAGDTALERRVGAAYVSSEFLTVLGVGVARGRLFARDDADPADPRLIAVISHELWTSRFAADPSIVGRSVRLGSREFTVIGVTATGFAGIDLLPTHVWLPLSNQRTISYSKGQWWQARGALAWRVVTRVREPVTASQINARIERSIAEGLRAAGEPPRESNAQLGSIISARGPLPAEQEHLIATRLAGVSLVLLLISIANVTNLLLTRALRRRREIAVRRALGVTQLRLLRSFVLEAALYALLAAAAATGCSILLGGVVRSLLLPSSAWTPPAVDARAIAFTALLALMCVLVAGLLPALHAFRSEAFPLLKSGAPQSGERVGWLRTTLLGIQAALSAVLLVGAGLFLTSLERVKRVDVGYELAPLVAITTFEARPGTFEALRDRVAALPDVEAAALVSTTPLRGLSGYDTFLPGHDSALADGPDMYGVDSEFFRTTGLRITRGRAFAPTDRRGSPPVIILNEAVARAYWPNGNALNGCVRLESRNAPCYTVVGISANARRFRLIEEPVHQAFIPLEHLPDQSTRRALLIRVRGDPTAAAQIALRELADPVNGGNQASAFYYRDWLEPQLREWKMGSWLFGTVAALSLLLAVVGLYSVLAYAVTQRAQELGVRIALGADARRLVSLVVGQGMRPLLMGLVFGLGLAAGLGKLIAALLYDTSTVEPGVYLRVAAALVAAGALASVIPAVRAARIDPIRALKHE